MKRSRVLKEEKGEGTTINSNEQLNVLIGLKKEARKEFVRARGKNDVLHAMLKEARYLSLKAAVNSSIGYSGMNDTPPTVNNNNNKECPVVPLKKRPRRNSRNVKRAIVYAPIGFMGVRNGVKITPKEKGRRRYSIDVENMDLSFLNYEKYVIGERRGKNIAVKATLHGIISNNELGDETKKYLKGILIALVGKVGISILKKRVIDEEGYQWN